MSTNDSLSISGQIPASTGCVELNIKGALVSISHEDRNDISLKTNHPNNWAIQNGSVSQTKVQKPLGGETVISNVSINGNVISTGKGSTVVRTNGNITIINGEIWVNGKKVTNSDKPSDQTDAANEPDELEILIPNNYGGSLRINYENGSEVTLDNWKGGNVSFSSTGGAILKVGNLTSLSSFALRSTGSGDINIKAIETNSFMATKTGSGDLDIEELNTQSLLLTQTGSGDTNIANGSATAGSVSSTGSGDISMRGRFANITKHGVGSGKIKIRTRE